MTIWAQRRYYRTLLPLLLVTLSLLLVVFGCSQNNDDETESLQSVAANQISTNGSDASEPQLDETPVIKPEVNADADSPGQESMVEYLPQPDTLEKRFSYTYGYMLMATAMRDVQDIDPVYFARGAYDAGLKMAPLIPEGSMNTVLYEYQDKLIREAARRLEELAKKNLEDAESFLAVNGKREGVITTPSGLQYEIVEDSEGELPTAEDTVQVHYRLTYLDGREGDASIRGIPSTFELEALIPGFREGLMLMPVGSVFKFYVHPSLGYGIEGSTRIEPNTLLIFDVELVEIL